MTRNKYWRTGSPFSLNGTTLLGRLRVRITSSKPFLELGIGNIISFQKLECDAGVIIHLVQRGYARECFNEAVKSSIPRPFNNYNNEE